jgi:hypothetical protein
VFTDNRWSISALLLIYSLINGSEVGRSVLVYTLRLFGTWMLVGNLGNHGLTYFGSSWYALVVAPVDR